MSMEIERILRDTDLQEEERNVIFRGIVQLAKADGEMDPREREYLRQVVAEFFPGADFNGMLSAWRPIEKWTVRGAYGILYDADSFNGYNPTPLGKPTSTAWGGTYSLGSNPLQAWAGIFNWDNGIPSDVYSPAGLDPSWGNKNRPGMIDPGYGRTPYIQQWNVHIQRELPRRLVFEAGYVGTKGTGLRVGELARINQLPVRALDEYGTRLGAAISSAEQARAAGVPYPYTGFSGTVSAALRQYPQVFSNQTINVYGSPLGFSTYNALQVSLIRRFGRDLTLNANYVWSKSLTNLKSSLIGDNSGPLDYYNLQLEKAVVNYDTPHEVKAYANYAFPVGRGRRILSGAPRAVDAVLGGWSFAAIVNYSSGAPLGFSAPSPLSNGWNGAVNRANVAAGPLGAPGFDKKNFELSSAQSPNNTYLNKALFSTPAPLRLGTSAPRYAQIRDFGTANEDLTLHKVFRVTEGASLQLRCELLNAFNRHTLGGISTSINSVNFGQVTTVSGNRQIQLGVRFEF